MVLEIKIIYSQMAEEADTGLTSIDFLSKLKVSPKKKKVFSRLSLNTDLEEINQFLASPVARVQKIAIPTVLDLEKTKTFVMSLLMRYEKPEDIEKKWQGFLQSVSSPQQFERYVSSLKEIAPCQKTELCGTNPQSTGELEDSKKKVEKRKTVNRAFSTKKLQNNEKAVKQAKPITASKLRQLLKQQMNQLKDLLLAGEKFIRSA